MVWLTARLSRRPPIAKTCLVSICWCWWPDSFTIIMCVLLVAGGWESWVDHKLSEKNTFIVILSLSQVDVLILPDLLILPRNPVLCWVMVQPTLEKKTWWWCFDGKCCKNVKFPCSRMRSKSYKAIKATREYSPYTETTPYIQRVTAQCEKINADSNMEKRDLCEMKWN